MRNGVGEEKIVEIVLQVVVYCPFPATLDGMKTVADAIGGFRKEAGSASQ